MDNNDILNFFPYGYEDILDRDLGVHLLELCKMYFRFCEVCEINGSDRDVKKIAHWDGIFADPKGLDSLCLYKPGCPRLSFKLINSLRELFRLLSTPEIKMIEATAAPAYGYFNSRQIEEKLHKAIFLQNGTPVFEAMDVVRPTLKFQAGDIVSMACWIASDAIVNLLYESLSSVFDFELARELERLANEFSNRYGFRSSSLFSNDAENTCNELYYILTEIDRDNIYKSSHCLSIVEVLYEIISESLSVDGRSWVMNGFAYAWESICLDFAVKNFNNKGDCIFTCDAKFLDRRVVEKGRLDEWESNRKKVFSHNARDRAPDLVLRNSNTGAWRIIDFKYYDNVEFTKNEKRPYHKDYKFCKLAQDLDNLDAYGLLLKSSQSKNNIFDVSYELWVPGMNDQSLSWDLKSNDGSQWNIKILRKNTPWMVKEYSKDFKVGL